MRDRHGGGERTFADPSGTVESRRAKLAFVALVSGALAIAFSPIFVKLSEIPPTATAFYRVFLAVPPFAVWAALEGRRSEGGRSAAGRVEVKDAAAGASRAHLIKWLLLAGLFFAGDLAFWHWSLAYTSVANSTLLANLAPVFVTAAAWVLFRERVSALFLLGLLVALAGAMLLLRASFSFGREHLLGDGLATLTAVFYAGYLISVKELRRYLGTARLMAASSLVSAVPLFLISLAGREGFLPQTVFGWLMLAGVAWVSQVFGQGLIAYGLAHLPASFSSVSLLVQPAAAALLAWAILGEQLTAWQALGGVGVMGGIFLARRGSRL
jgi:drug/metabolite transporter (DMT)-like permease